MGSVYGWEMGAPETPDAMYRGTFTPHENGADYRVWYGAAGTSGWRIGYCDVPQKHWTDLG